MTERTRRWLLLISVSVAGFALDIGTKAWAEHGLQRAVRVPLLGDILSLILVYNKNAVFGLDPRAVFPWMPVNVVFSIFMAIAIIVVLFYYRSVASQDALVRWGLVMVMPGALGNLYDRLVRPSKGVVDFIMLDLGIWPANPWPIFNFADLFVTAGVLLILASLVREEWRRKALKPVPPASPSGEQPVA